VQRLGRAAPDELADALNAEPRAVQRALHGLRRRRLVMQLGEEYIVVGAHRGG
jgi:DNA-binding IclR family transcriptional regulator